MDVGIWRVDLEFWIIASVMSYDHSEVDVLVLFHVEILLVSLLWPNVLFFIYF